MCRCRSASNALWLLLAAAMLGGCPGDSADNGGGADSNGANGDGTDANDGASQTELVVSVAPGAQSEDLDGLYAELGVTLRERLTALSIDLLSVDETQLDDVITSLNDSPFVDGVDNNEQYDLQPTPNDALYALQWHLEATNVPAAWAITTGSEQMLIAVLDTGVDIDHADLAQKLRGGANTFDSSSSWDDLNGHGTEVAGIIAAESDNAGGVASVAWKNPLLPIRVTDQDNHTTSWALAAGIGLAVDQGARVINISFAPLHEDAIVLRQAERARALGALVVLAAGNSGEQVTGGGSDAALFVGALDQDDSLAGFSNYGDFVDLTAPGVSIYTTRRDNEYGRADGTSHAAPIVSGVAALVWSVNPSLLPSTVQGILLSTATDLGPAGDDSTFGAGKVNALAAVELALAIQETVDETPPALSIREPSDGASVGGAITIGIDVSDDSDLADVTLLVDGNRLASDTIAPYAFALETTRYAPGAHELEIVATDVFGNAARVSITLSFSGPPDESAPGVRLISPAVGDTLSGTVTLLADATDDRLLARAEFLVDDQLIGTVALDSAEARAALSWNIATSSVTSGEHTISVRILDTSGNVATDSVNVVVAR